MKGRRGEGMGEKARENLAVGADAGKPWEGLGLWRNDWGKNRVLAASLVCPVWVQNGPWTRGREDGRGSGRAGVRSGRVLGVGVGLDGARRNIGTPF